MTSFKKKKMLDQQPDYDEVFTEAPKAAESTSSGTRKSSRKQTIRHYLS